MTKFKLFANFVFCVTIIFYGCDNEKIDTYDTLKPSEFIEGLTIDNYPIIDGSTSTFPLNTIIASRLLGINFKWVEGRELRHIEPNLNKNNRNRLFQQVRNSQTHQSFVNLINNKADIVLSARRMSPDEKAIADAAGVTLIETPIALDALVFIVNPNNPIHSLTTTQIQEIYMLNITNWNEVGGNDLRIQPFVRNPNSGSQELMELLVMKDLVMPWHPENWPELIQLSGMIPAIDEVAWDVTAICYTVFYFKEHMVVNAARVKTIGIDGIYPDTETIRNRSYPFVTGVYVVIRSDLDKSSMAYKIYEWLQTEEGRQVIIESGYIPYN